MKTLIRLTTENDSDVWVNPDHIACVFPLEDNNGSACYITHEKRSIIIVQEPPETIIQKISVIK